MLPDDGPASALYPWPKGGSGSIGSIDLVGKSARIPGGVIVEMPDYHSSERELSLICWYGLTRFVGRIARLHLDIVIRSIGRYRIVYSS